MTCERVREGNSEAGSTGCERRHDGWSTVGLRFAQGETCHETSRQSLVCVRVKPKTVECAEPHRVNWTSAKHKSECDLLSRRSNFS